jgi:phage host-nuclease inhibitor protein Gam
MILGVGKVRLADLKARVDVSQEAALLTPVTDEAIPVSWEQAQEVGFPVSSLTRSLRGTARFAELPAVAAQAKRYTAWGRDLASWLYANRQLNLFKSPSSGAVSQPGESERDFRVRLQQTAREGRDAQVDKLRKKYAPKLAALDERIRRAERAVEREAEQAKGHKLRAAVSVGATLLGAFTGRRLVSSTTVNRAATAARAVSRSADSRQDIEQARESLSGLQQQRADLEAQFNGEVAAMEAKADPQAEPLETVVVKPKKADVTVQLVVLVWAPHWVGAQETTRPAW